MASHGITLLDRIELWCLNRSLRRATRNGHVCGARTTQGYWCTEGPQPHTEHHAKVDDGRTVARWYDERYPA